MDLRKLKQRLNKWRTALRFLDIPGGTIVGVYTPFIMVFSLATAVLVYKDMVSLDKAVAILVAVVIPYVVVVSLYTFSVFKLKYRELEIEASERKE